MFRGSEAGIITEEGEVFTGRFFGARTQKVLELVFNTSMVGYHVDNEEELALINYTSGTTGFSKGVMLPYRALTGNTEFCSSCFDGVYPTKIPADVRKNRFEQKLSEKNKAE